MNWGCPAYDSEPKGAEVMQERKTKLIAPVIWFMTTGSLALRWE